MGNLLAALGSLPLAIDGIKSLRKAKGSNGAQPEEAQEINLSVEIQDQKVLDYAYPNFVMPTIWFYYDPDRIKFDITVKLEDEAYNTKEIYINFSRELSEFHNEVIDQLLTISEFADIYNDLYSKFVAL